MKGIDLGKILSDLQQKPYKTRIKILWSTTAVLAVILIVAWTFSVKSEVKKLSGEELINLPEFGEEEKVTAQFIKVERVELTEGSFNVFFSVKNETSDILTFSSTDEIKLSVDDNDLKPLQIRDRQNKTFVQKILSKTENFGILVFPTIDADYATLTFEDLYLEKQPENTFKEIVELNIVELKKAQPLRD